MSECFLGFHEKLSLPARPHGHIVLPISEELNWAAPNGALGGKESGCSVWKEHRRNGDTEHDRRSPVAVIPRADHNPPRCGPTVARVTRRPYRDRAGGTQLRHPLRCADRSEGGPAQ